MPDGKMDNAPSKTAYQEFQHSSGLFGNLAESEIGQLVSSGTDLSLVISENGTVIDVAYRHGSLKDYDPEAWIGKKWRDTVTAECREKIDTLISECVKGRFSRPHQVNHPKPPLSDLPVEYVLNKIDGTHAFVAFGTDLRKFAEIQQQLIEAQFELEREYRRIREAEARYRIIFQKMDRAIAVIDADQKRILDANSAASALLGAPPGKLAGETFLSFFDRADRANITAAFDAAREKGVGRSVQVRRASDEEELILTVDPFRETGQINFLLSISARRDAHPDGPGGSFTRFDWLEIVPEAAVMTDAKGMVIAINDRFLDLLHVLNRNQVIGRNINNWLGASNVDMQVLLSRLHEEGEVSQFQSALRDELGASRAVRLNALYEAGSNEPTVVILVAEQTARDAGARFRGAGPHAANADFSELIGRVPLKELIRESVDVIEKLCIEAALRQTENNRASAADLLGLSRQSLYIKLRRHGLESFDGSD
ncbi:MAG: transcriptional regulator PpsR [Roseibium sp.]|nr:transcriptional regulator PpsR [Roseibium sp.]